MCSPMLILALLVFSLLTLSDGLVMKFQQHGRECLQFVAAPNTNTTVTYSTVPEQSSRFSVSITRQSDGEVVYYTGEGIFGRWSYGDPRSTQNENFSFCVATSFHYPVSVDFSIRTTESLLSSVATEDKVIRLKYLVDDLHQKILDLGDQQRHMLRNEQLHRTTAQATNHQVLWWIMLKAVTIIASVLIQNYYLRSYFEIKLTV